MAPTTHLLHGLRVRSELPLAEPPAEAKADDVDVDVDLRVAAPAPVPRTPPPGELLAALDIPAARYAAVARPGGALIRFFGAAEFAVELESGSVTVTADPEAHPDLVSVLFAGNVLALLLGLRGEHALHAGAVQLGGRCVALAGGSGAGKSTLAALLCAGGARLVADDLLRVDGRRGHRGAGEIRLRPSAADVIALYPPDRRRPTGDGRTAVRPDRAAEDLPRLDAVIFPIPRRDGRPFALHRLGEREAHERLLLAPRVAGWRAPEALRAQFRAAAELAEQVPVLRADIPWGPPFRTDLAARVHGALAEALA